MNVLDKTKVWHQSKTGLLVFGLTELAVAYACASWAIDSGRLSAWLLSIVLSAGAIWNLVKLAGRLVHAGTAARPHKRSSVG